MILFTIAFVFWVSCAAFSVSIFLAEFEKDAKYWSTMSYRSSLGVAWLMGLATGPLAALLSIFLSGFLQNGLMTPFKLRPWIKKV